MRFVPPLTDRDGNIHVLYGAPDRTDTQVFVGRISGGWSGGCSAHRGVDGLHGFVGRSQDRVWYWSGTALVEVDGGTGACNQILRDDPVSGTELSFLGVAPYVDETPSRRFAYGIARGGTGDINLLMVDLDRALPFNTTPFAEDADVVEVIGTGVWASVRVPAFVVRVDGVAKALFVDRFGGILREVSVDLPEAVGPYGIPGFIQFSDAGVGVGITETDRLFVLDGDGGGFVDTPFDPPEGVLAWEGEVYVTGMDGDTPTMARISATGEVGSAFTFGSAELAHNRLGSPIQVNDERGDPARSRTWDEPQTAIADYPLLTPWPIDPYTTWSAGWLVAGPGFSSGVEPVTAVAFAPVGLELP